MKRCPKCDRSYTDETLNFCLDDGISLMVVKDEFETVVRPKNLNVFKVLIPVAVLFFLILLVSLAIGFYQSKDQIASLFDPDPRPPSESPQDPDSSPEEREKEAILNVLKTVREAWVENDLDVLDEIMAEEYEEENSYGQRLTKKQILSPVLIGRRISLKHSDIVIEFNEDETEATVMGKGVSKAEVGGVEMTYRFSFKTDFEKRDGRWQATYSYLNFQE